MKKGRREQVWKERVMDTKGRGLGRKGKIGAVDLEKETQKWKERKKEKREIVRDGE